MTGNTRYKPVGGVAHVELFAVQGFARVEDMVQGAGLTIALMDDGSHYDEHISSDHLPVSVQHTLTLCAPRSQASAWFDSDFLAHASAEGVVARIALCSGEKMMIGWSPKFGFEQALRLRSLQFHSGDRPQQTPTVELTLCSCDTLSALNK